MRTIFLLVLCILLNACISKKKYLEEISALTTKQQSESDSLLAKLNGARGEINRLQLQLAERKGENSALTAMQDKLQARIDQLESEIENMGSQARSTQQNLSQDLRQRDREINNLKQQIRTIGTVLDEWENQMATIAQTIGDSLQGYEVSLWNVEVLDGNASVVLREEFVFRSNSVSRLEEEGMEALEKISNVLQRYPNTLLTVIVHTDNTPPRNKSYKDNWNFSTLRSATVARLLTEEFYVNANQVTAAGKGEFAPIASNETSEGRAKNRRVELRVAPRTENMIREVRRKLEGGD